MSLTDEAVEKIKQMIIEGHLRAGDRLPREQELARELGLSRGSLREAVRALTMMRILDTRQGDGTYVTALSPDDLIGTMGFVIDFQPDKSLLDFFHVRRVLEAEAAAAAAPRIQDADLDDLRRLLQDADAMAQIKPLDHAAMLVKDQEFHRTINRIGGNPVLAAITDSMSGNTNRARTWRGVADREAPNRTLQDHWAIFHALRDRDPERARLRAAIHVSNVEDWLREHALGKPDGVGDNLTAVSATDTTVAP